MKIVKVLLVTILLSLTASANAISYPHHYRPIHPHPIIGAPLDGGILAVLGAAGVAYYAYRKNRKNNPGA